MNNKAVIAFLENTDKRVKYGNWVSDFNTLYYKGVRVSEKLQCGKLKVDTFSLVDCDFNSQMFNAIHRVTEHLLKCN